MPDPPKNHQWPLLYRALFDLTRHVERVARGLFYLSVGTLGRADVLDMSQRAWRNFNDDEAAAGELYSWERAVYDGYLQKGDRVLVVGSGLGRDLLAFAKAGHETVGVEPGPETAAAARRLLAVNGHSADVIEAFFEDAVLPGRFDVIVFSYCTYCYIPGSSHRVAALERAALHLNAGGRIILTFLSTQAPFRTNGIAVMRFAARLMRSDWRPEQNDMFNRVDIRERLLQYEHWFPPGELESEVRAAGLRIVHQRLLPDMPTVVLKRAEA